MLSNYYCQDLNLLHFRKKHSTINSCLIAPYYTIIYPNLLIMNTFHQEPRSSVQPGHDDKAALQVSLCLTSFSFVKFCKFLHLFLNQGMDLDVSFLELYVSCYVGSACCFRMCLFWICLIHTS